MQFIDRASATNLLRSIAPDATWLLKHIEAEDGYVRFPPVFLDIVRNLNIENYPKLYENEAHIGAMMLRAFVAPENIAALNDELAGLSPGERGTYVEEAGQALEAAGNAFELPKTPAQIKRAQRAFDALSEVDKKASIQFWQYFTMAVLAGFHQLLSIMVHGEKLTALVAQAKAGDDKAFAKAIQIDKRILNAVPYFSRRFSEANAGGNRAFAEEIAAHLQRPPYKGRIRHKSLYLAFAFLGKV